MTDESLVTLQRAWQMSARQAHLPAVEQRLQAAAGLALTRPARTALLHLSDGRAAPRLRPRCGCRRRCLDHEPDASSAGRIGIHRPRAGRGPASCPHFAHQRRGAGRRAIACRRSDHPPGGALWLVRDDRDELSRLLVRFADDFSTYLRQTSNQTGKGKWNHASEVLRRYPRRAVKACAEAERQPVFPECSMPSLRDRAVRAEGGPERHL